MSNRKKTALWVIALSFTAGALIWHMIAWHSNGMHLEIFQFTETGKSYLAALYNLAVMLVIGGLLGFLMVKVTDLVSRKVSKLSDPDEEKNEQ